jgi:hypothetical protein
VSSCPGITLTLALSHKERGFAGRGFAGLLPEEDGEDAEDDHGPCDHHAELAQLPG